MPGVDIIPDHDECQDAVTRAQRGPEEVIRSDVQVIARYSPRTEPGKLADDIEAALNAER